MPFIQETKTTTLLSVPRIISLQTADVVICRGSYFEQQTGSLVGGNDCNSRRQTFSMCPHTSDLKKNVFSCCSVQRRWWWSMLVRLIYADAISYGSSPPSNLYCWWNAGRSILSSSSGLDLGVNYTRGHTKMFVIHPPTLDITIWKGKNNTQVFNDLWHVTQHDDETHPGKKIFFYFQENNFWKVKIPLESMRALSKVKNLTKGVVEGIYGLTSRVVAICIIKVKVPAAMRQRHTLDHPWRLLTRERILLVLSLMNSNILSIVSNAQHHAGSESEHSLPVQQKRTADVRYGLI